MTFWDLAQIASEQKTAYSYGDEWLYRMCHAEESVFSEPTTIASTIWIIGRSYAASPERIKRNIDTPDSTIQKNGAEKFFLELSKNDCLKKLVSKKSFDKYSYDENGSENDMKLLKESLKNVVELNEALKKAGSLNDNPISFSSKYLHFFYPNSVFITDQFSRNGSRWLFHKSIRKKKAIRISDSESITLDECRKAMVNDKCDSIKIYDSVKTIMGDMKKDFSNNKTILEYIDHSCCCYALACSLKQNGIEGIRIFDSNISMPRLVDTVLLKVGSDE